MARPTKNQIFLKLGLIFALSLLGISCKRKKTGDSQVKITNGFEINKDNPLFKHLAYLGTQINSLLCSAVVIHENWLLTDRHCVSSLQNAQGTIFAIFGSKEAGHNLIEIDKNASEVITDNEGFAMAFDIALIKLKSSVFSIGFSPILLLPDRFIPQNWTDSEVTVSGYGQNENFVDQSSPYGAQLRIKEAANTPHFPALFVIEDGDVSDGIQSACMGDSGGAISFSHYDQVYLIGLVRGSIEEPFYKDNYSSGCNTGAFLATNVLHYKRWIRKTIGIAADSTASLFQYDKLSAQVNSLPLTITNFQDLCSRPPNDPNHWIAARNILGAAKVTRCEEMGSKLDEINLLVVKSFSTTSFDPYPYALLPINASLNFLSEGTKNRIIPMEKFIQARGSRPIKISLINATLSTHELPKSIIVESNN